MKDIEKLINLAKSLITLKIRESITCFKVEWSCRKDMIFTMN